MRAACLFLALLVLGGWWLAPRERLDTEVEQTGFLQTDRRKTLSATVESLRAMNKLAVYSYKGTVHVRVDRTKWIILTGEQELIIPGVVTYLVDLSRLTYAYDEQQQVVTVRLPPLELGDIAFEPEQATTLNGGLLTYSQAQVNELLRQNYKAARRAMTKQAQGDGFRAAAGRQAQEAVGGMLTRAAPGVTVAFE